MITFMERIHNILTCTTKIFTLEKDLTVKSILMKQSLVKSPMMTNMWSRYLVLIWRKEEDRWKELRRKNLKKKKNLLVLRKMDSKLYLNKKISISIIWQKHSHLLRKCKERELEKILLIQLILDMHLKIKMHSLLGLQKMKKDTISNISLYQKKKFNKKKKDSCLLTVELLRK